jgi:hypothetical protein
MTEPETPYEAEPPPQTSTDTHAPDAETLPATEEATPPERSLLPWLCALGFVVLAGAVGFAWWHPRAVPTPQAAEVRDLRLQVQGLKIRMAQLEQDSSGGVDLGPLKARVAALEKRPPPDLAPLETRVAALEKRPAPDLAPLEARIAALEQKTQDEQQLGARVDALSGRMDALSGRDRGADAQLEQRLTTDEARLATLEHEAAQVTAEAAQTARLARIAVAEAALNAGQKLGDIPGAPSAVARFAAVPPPTEAALRLAFPAAAHAALAAAAPTAAGEPFLARVLSRAEDLVTVRQGDHVLIGDSAAGVLAHARTALDAGDLAGAVAAVSTLSGPPAAAMAGWRADAQALLDARAALAAMAAQT